MKYRKFKTPEQLAEDDMKFKHRKKRVTHIFSFDETKLKPIPNFPHHFACENGGIYSNKMNAHHKKVTFRQVKTYLTGSDSPTVKLTMEDGKQKQFSVARLLAITFIGEPQHESMRAYVIDNLKPMTSSNVRWGVSCK